ncbi:hypothetical protein [Saccharopolyspora karakumensis]|uniref:hypothetical protein n=1 Tax=Saccharopolyspora karakumensis TaxID=2530386 RepID=UPI00140542A9|nr:hypothetical protein [Saccharopolyspora karakumensis]
MRTDALRDELLDGQREIEATRQRIEGADHSPRGAHASEDFLNDHQTGTWADQTALDDFRQTPPVDAGVRPIEDYEPGQRAGDDVSDLPVTEPATPPPVHPSGEPPTADAATDKVATLRTGQKKPDWTLKPGEAQPTPGPSAPAGSGDPLPPVSQIAKLAGGHSTGRVGAEVAKSRFKKIGVVAVGAAAAAGLIYTFWPGGDTPEPRPAESPVVEQAPVEPEPGPPNTFEPFPFRNRHHRIRSSPVAVAVPEAMRNPKHSPRTFVRPRQHGSYPGGGPDGSGRGTDSGGDHGGGTGG